jgi:hypothetical protein
MRAGLPRITIAHMPSTIRLQLELDPALDPIGGIVRHPPTGAPMPFAGWLQLTEILEAIRRAGAEAQ